MHLRGVRCVCSVLGEVQQFPLHHSHRNYSHTLNVVGTRHTRANQSFLNTRSAPDSLRAQRYTQCALTCVRGLDGPTPCECVANLCVLQLYDEQMCSACKFASYLSASFKSLVWIRRLAERISAAHSGSSRLPATWRGCAKLDVSTCGDVQDTSGCSGELLRCSQVYLGSSSHLWRHF